MQSSYPWDTKSFFQRLLIWWRLIADADADAVRGSGHSSNRTNNTLLGQAEHLNVSSIQFNAFFAYKKYPFTVKGEGK